MKGLSRKLKKYVVTLSTIMILVLFSAASVFATGATDSTVEETEAGVTAKDQMIAMLDRTELKVEEGDYSYTGSEIKPEASLIYTDEMGVESDVTEMFVWTPVYSENVNAGEASVSAVISGYYEDEDNEAVNFDEPITSLKAAYFTINAADLSKTVLTLSQSSYTYDGTAKKPTVTVTLNGKTVTNENNKNYTVVYTDNVNAGTAKVTVTGTGNYSGEKTAYFKINAADLSKATLTVGQSSYIYDGTAKKPAVTVTLNGKTVTNKNNENYTVIYTGNVNAGTAKVTVTGTGNYSGKLAKSFKITAKSISSATVKLSAVKYAYNGKTQKPSVTVKIKNASTVVTLKKDVDYTVAYSTDCKNPGSKTVTITGKGNYAKSIKKTYSIVPEKATGLKVTKRTTSSLTVTCTKAKVSGCSYRFKLKTYNNTTKKWEDASSKYTTTNSATFTGLTAGRAYQVYVKVYKKIGSKYYSGAWSNCLEPLTKPAKPVMSNAVKTGSKSMKVTWKAVNSATGYEIQYSSKSDFSSYRIVKVTGRTTTSKSISKLASTGTYYVRVRAYKVYNGNTYKGDWSSKISTAWTNVYASYTTTYNAGNTNRSTNLRLACQAMNGKILSNGETFSFNAIVGERTAAKGYKEAIIYEGGQEVGGIGGGICQVATTLFNAALKANFTIVERYQHSLTVHYAPLGYDAAIAWGSKNLRFRNNSGVSVKVSAVASGGTLKVKFLTNTYKKPPTVTTKVTVRNGVYTLKRYVNGTCNYTTTSDYLDN